MLLTGEEIDDDDDDDDDGNLARRSDLLVHRRRGSFKVGQQQWGPAGRASSGVQGQSPWWRVCPPGSRRHFCEIRYFVTVLRCMHDCIRISAILNGRKISGVIFYLLNTTIVTRRRVNTTRQYDLTLNFHHRLGTQYPCLRAVSTGREHG